MTFDWMAMHDLVGLCSFEVDAEPWFDTRPESTNPRPAPYETPPPLDQPMHPQGGH